MAKFLFIFAARYIFTSLPNAVLIATEKLFCFHQTAKFIDVCKRKKLLLSLSLEVNFSFVIKLEGAFLMNQQVVLHS
jgi:hypothetical protein